MARGSEIRISSDLGISIGTEAVTVSPSEGLLLAEELARKSFRRALAEEACLPDDASRADSDEFSRRFQLNPATDSERSQPGVPMIPAG